MGIETGYDLIVQIVFWASIIYLLLPPIEVFDDFPRFRKYYSLVVRIVGNIAVSNRGKVMSLYSQYREKNNAGKVG